MSVPELYCSTAKPVRTTTVICLLVSFSVVLLGGCGESPATITAQATKPALTVESITPQVLDWPKTLKANGNIAAWQEAVIGPELSNYRIAEVLVSVGDVVKKGQLLARIAPDTVDNELAESRAAVAEAEATLAEARANHERSKLLREKGFYSAQQSVQTQTVADTALARLNAARARLQTAQLRRANANVTASDEGIISSRTATVGTLTQTGQELFRLIRGGRLEWRAEVTAAELGRLKTGQFARLISPNGEAVEGTVRAIAPTVDAKTRTALVYVDLPSGANKVVSAGMFATGEFNLGQEQALTLPQSAVVIREGFAYVFRLEQGKVVQAKVDIGRRNGERIEVSGLDASAQVVAGGAGFLADGDSVRVIPAVSNTQSTPQHDTGTRP